MDEAEIKENMLRISKIAMDDQAEVKSIRYINELNIIPETDNYIGWKEDSLYIVEKEREDGENSTKTYEIYNKNNELIATTDENGKLLFEEEYLQTIQQLIEEKFNGLIKYEEMGIGNNEREIYLEEILSEKELEEIKLEKVELEKIEQDEDLKNNEKEIEDDSQEEKKVDEFSEQELINAGNGWEDFFNVIEIKETDSIYKEFPELESPLYIGYDKSGKFKTVTINEKGEPTKSKLIEESRSTMKETIHIDDSGEPVKTMVPTAVMNTSKDDIKISVKIGQYGYIEAQKLQRTHENKYIATDIDRVGNKDKTYDVKYATDNTKQGSYGNDKLAKNHEEREENSKEKINLDEIDNNVNIESIKRQIIDDAIEDYDNMTRDQLDEYIKSELNSKLGDNRLDKEEILQEIHETIEDEVRFPTRGSKE